MENIPSATLVTEYQAAQAEEKVVKERLETLKKEMTRRINAGMTVQNDKATAVLQERAKRTYQVKAALQAIRKYKLDAASLLSVVNAAVQKLPEDVQAMIPYVEKPGFAFTLKPRK